MPTTPCQLGCLGGSVGKVTLLKAGGCGFESHMSSHFFYENRKEGSQARCLVCLSSHAITQYHLAWLPLASQGVSWPHLFSDTP